MKKPVDVFYKIVRVDVVAHEQLVQLLMRIGVLGFLSDKATHLHAQAAVLYARHHGVKRTTEPALAFGQQKEEHVDGVHGLRIVRYPVQGRVIKTDPRLADRQTLRCSWRHTRGGMRRFLGCAASCESP